MACEVPIIQTLVGEAIARTHTIEAMVGEFSHRILDGLPMEALALGKYISSEFLWATVDDLVQVLGGRGYDEANGVPQLLRDARVYRIFEGASEALIDFVGQRALFNVFGPSFLEALCAPELAAKVRTVLLTLKDNSRGDPDGVRKRSKLAGDIVTWAILVACLEQAKGDSSTSRPAVLVWAQSSLDRLCEAVSKPLPSTTVCFAKDELLGSITAICQAIGDVEELLPGEQQEIDPLLSRRPVTL